MYKKMKKIEEINLYRRDDGNHHLIITISEDSDNGIIKFDLKKITLDGYISDENFALIDELIKKIIY